MIVSDIRSVMQDTVPVTELSLLDYRYALDGVMPLLCSAAHGKVICDVPGLVREVNSRKPDWSEGEPSIALWIEPLTGNWRSNLQMLADTMTADSRLIIIASRPLARLLPEQRRNPSHSLGRTAGGIPRLRRALRGAGFRITETHGIHTVVAVALSLGGTLISRCGRPDVGDRLLFASRLHYTTHGLLAPLSTVTLLFARRERFT